MEMTEVLDKSKEQCKRKKYLSPVKMVRRQYFVEKIVELHTVPQYVHTRDRGRERGGGVSLG